MSLQSIFNKGNFEPIKEDFQSEGKTSLRHLSLFQEKFNTFDTDTTINAIRDSIIASYLGYDLINTEKHGFDAKKSKTGEFLEIKQCSITSGSWGGTWNDTNEEKAKAFGDPRVFTAVGVWRSAADLEFIVYGQNQKMGEYLYQKVISRKSGSRSTQSISIQKLIKDWGFVVFLPPGKSKQFAIQDIVQYQKSLNDYVTLETIKTVSNF
jgi:hypothetical protein